MEAVSQLTRWCIIADASKGLDYPTIASANRCKRSTVERILLEYESVGQKWRANTNNPLKAIAKRMVARGANPYRTWMAFFYDVSLAELEGCRKSKPRRRRK